MEKLKRANGPIILASRSPRRRELLERMGIDFNLMPCDVDESFDDKHEVAEIAKEIAKLKAHTAIGMLEDGVVISADTIVVIDNKILGKPVDRDDAIRMIKLLSNRWHEVITGICICTKSNELIHAESTKVHFVDMSEQEIQSYVDIGESYDKAGAYGVQGQAGKYIDRIEGDYYNIMGFPMAKVAYMLKEIGAI